MQTQTPPAPRLVMYVLLLHDLGFLLYKHIPLCYARFFLERVYGWGGRGEWRIEGAEIGCYSECVEVERGG